MNFKDYPRKYERVFIDKNKKCKLERVSTYNDIPKSNIEYINLFRKTIKDLQDGYFDNLVKYNWLVRRFCYGGIRRKNFSRNGNFLDGAFGVFMRHFVGFENRFICTYGACGGKIISYFDDFFPNFDEGNPFKEEYKYPYKHITLEYLFVVYQMPERLKILRRAEEQKMLYPKFLDYVLNYILCYNEEHGEKYIFVFSNWLMPYIKAKKNYEGIKTSSIRSGK